MVCTRWWWCGGAALGHANGQVGFGPETRNRAPGARLRVRRGEWQSGVMGGCGGMAYTRWWWWCGGAVLCHANGQVGFGPENPNRAPGALLQVRHGEWLSEAMWGGGWMVHTRWWRCGGAAFGHASGAAAGLAKSLKASRRGSVSGAPLETAIKEDGGRW